MSEAFFDVSTKLGQVAKAYTLKDANWSESPPDDLVGKAALPCPTGLPGAALPPQ